MRIAIAAPMTLRLLTAPTLAAGSVPVGYDFPMTAFLVNALLARGHEVVAITTSSDLTEAFKHRDGALTIVVVPRRQRHVGRDLFRSERKWLTRAMQDASCDVVHAHWTYEFAWAALDSGLPTVVTVHDHARTVFRHHPDPYRLARWLMNVVVLQRARHLTAVSSYLWGLLSAGQRAKTRVIPNFLPPVAFSSSGLPSHRNDLLVTVSNGFRGHKNVVAGLRAFSLLRRKRPLTRYRLIGQDMGPGEDGQQFSLSHGLADGVEFCGRQSFEQVLAAFSEAHCVLHPSLEESFGMSILEAMACSAAVVAGAHSGNVPFLIDRGRCGLLCDVSDADSIAAMLDRIWDDNALLETVRRNARAEAEAKYCDTTIVRQYEERYHAVLVSPCEVVQ